MSVRVRFALPNDADAIARVHMTSWRSAYSHLLPKSYLTGLRRDDLAARWHRRLKSAEIEEAVRVLEIDGRVGGFVSFGPQKDDASWLGFSGEVFMLYLEPSLIGRGLGSALIRRAYDELARCQCHWVVVWVLSKNELARSFYEREGLKLDGGRRWDAFGDRSVPVVRYARALNPVVDFEAIAASRKLRH